MALLDQIMAVAREHNAVRVDAVEVEVGILQQVVPEALEMAFAAAAEGTPAEGARLAIVERPARAECRACRQQFAAGVGHYLCPACQQADVTILEGNDVILSSITCEVDDSQAS